MDMHVDRLMSTSVLDCSFLAHFIVFYKKHFIIIFTLEIVSYEGSFFMIFWNDMRRYVLKDSQQISVSTVTQFQVRGPVTDTYLFLRTITNVYFGIVSLN